MRFILSTFATILLLSLPSYAAEGEENSSTENTAEAGSSPTPAPQIPRTEPNTDKNRILELLKSQDPETEILQLDTGKEDEKLIAFYRIEGSGIKQGGIIMFPDQSTHMDWPDKISYLREGLSDYGWYTLSIYLPQPARNQIPKRTLPVLSAVKPDSPNEASTEEGSGGEEQTEQNPIEEQPAPPAEAPNNTDAATPEDNAEQEPTEPYQDRTNRLGKAAFNHMKASDDLNRFIILGVGTGATWAAQYVQQNEKEQDLRLLMIDARDPLQENAPKLLSLLPEISSTIIDLHHSSRITNENDLTPESPARRLRLARHKRMNNFHQSRMPEVSDNWKRNNSWLLKHTRGMINTYIIKAEQNKRAIQLDNNQVTESEKAPG
ncbi:MULTISPECIES: DUF3530 family protein [unclassified Neptuniibacter]|uniref:DUF3530 family protein n=1 Tax=unclassified Neptuniibacter TaxID=2630693 RepID=UPI000C5AFA5F|nr:MULTISPECIES: DUF3530 family protein [unclassified Neptuniibacter]MAY42491.1 hypothetical protein [Oceanospirillaceae bacterium]|tara:strand:+ start:28555 stop:29688 length:1134 start_codon:yes stop_codon:yes gene_type:complete